MNILGTLFQATDKDGDTLTATPPESEGQTVLYWLEIQSISTQEDLGGVSLLVSPCFSAYISKSMRLMRSSF